jgi:predicted glutamine amidotransferase
MCGIFGYIARENKTINIKTLRAVATETMKRGPHSWGIAWIEAGSGVIRSYKQPGRIVDSLPLLCSLAKNAVALIGHCRWATHGDPTNNLNNHPHPADGGWIVHNGVIENYREVIAENDLAPTTECDSEVLGLLIERLPGTFASRAWEATEFTDDSALAMLGIWKPGRVIAVRRGNPLCMSHTRGGRWLASQATGLPGLAKMIANGVVLDIRIGKPTVSTLHPVPPKRQVIRRERDDLGIPSEFADHPDACGHYREPLLLDFTDTQEEDGGLAYRWNRAADPRGRVTPSIPRYGFHASKQG